jgi:hypothetical protein
MPLVVAASGPRLVTSPPLRPGQHLVGHLRGDRLPQSPKYLPNLGHSQGEELDAQIDWLLVGPPFATWALLLGRWLALRGVAVGGVSAGACRWARSTAR